MNEVRAVGKVMASSMWQNEEEVMLDVTIENDELIITYSAHDDKDESHRLKSKVSVNVSTIHDVLSRYEGYSDYRDGNFNCIIPEDYKRRQPQCTVCKRTKSPWGRSVADAMNGAYCDWDCEGYRQEPIPSSFWPMEFGAFNMSLFLASPDMRTALQAMVNGEYVHMSQIQDILARIVEPVKGETL